MTDTLAQLVRKKYPGAYDDLSDTELEAKVDAKYPGAYKDLPRSDASKELSVTPDPATGRVTTREDIEQGNSLYAPVGAGDVMGGLAMTPAGIGPALGPIVAGMGRAVGRVLPVGGMVGAATEFAKSHPTGTGAIIGALPGIVRGDLRETAIGAATGALGGKPILGRLGQAATKAAPVVAKAARAIPKAAQAAEEAAPVAATKIPDRGAAVAARHKQLVAFAKEIAEQNPKVGSKIWMLLDESGAPIRHLTPDQAGAAARKGLPTSWFRNLWE